MYTLQECNSDDRMKRVVMEETRCTQGATRNCYRILDERHGEKRPFRRNRHWWVDSIKMYLKK
jgi:hypothetical protein